MNYIYLVPSRYPTEKAYGVTIGNSLRSLRELGRSVTIVNWDNNGSDEYGNSLVAVNRRPIRISPKYYGKSNKLLSRSSYILNQLLFGIQFIANHELKSKETVYWVREPIVLIPFILKIREISALIEIHHKVSHLEKWTIRCLSLRHDVLLLVLNKSSAENHRKIFKNIQILESPMGVPKEFFRSRKKLGSELVTFGYLGKCSSSGHDNKISEIIKAGEILKQYKNITFKFIGLEEHCKRELQQMVKNLGLNPDSFVFHNHVIHDQIPNLLESVDFGILPYEGTPYNLERFPIKLLEYTASGLPVVASNIKPHSDLLREEYTFFYDTSELDGLAMAILKAYNSRDSYVSMSQAATLSANSYTYDKRVKLIDEILNRD